MRLPNLSAADCDHEFKQFQIGDAGHGLQLWGRPIIVMCVSVALWLATDLLITLVWGIGYVIARAAYVTYLRRQSFPVRPVHIVLASAASVFLGAWYGAMVIYIATLGEGEYILLSCCGAMGLGLHCLSRYDELSYAALIDFCTTLATALGVLVAAAQRIEPMWTSLATLVGGICVLIYFGISFRDIVTERQKMKRSMLAESQDEKMRALGQFTSGVAHDFNNLLTVVNGNIELAKIDPEGIEAHKYLEEAHAAGLKGAVLIQQLLAFARKSKIVVSDVNLTDMFSRLLGLLQRVLPAHIKLTLDACGNDIFVRADPAMLESALINLVINARDAMGETPGEIVISIDPFGAGDVEIAVRDTGPGMDDETLARATEPFFTTKAVGEGSGLGLSMVTGVVEQCGGRFELSNRGRGGLSARIYLPLVDLGTCQESA
ncbi:ATP-binding protein [uncultured Tateyamaria sp.]|uniref:sensor histidine kinase n=1 Tax=uncultured Tateyamaria sp. TaxID=455651 RepID=UPI0026052CCD|nr:ATP-binding protein [uncultured Tateyamaria sp.]